MEASEADFTSSSAPRLSWASDVTVREDGAEVVYAEGRTSWSSKLWAYAAIASDRSTCSIEYRVAGDVLEAARPIRPDEATAFRAAIEATLDGTPDPPYGDTSASATSQRQRTSRLRTFSYRLAKFEADETAAPFVAMDLPLEARKGSGVVRIHGSLRSFDRADANTISGALWTSGNQFPKAGGEVQIYDVETNQKIAAAALRPTRDPSETSANYAFELPKGRLAGDRQYVLVAGGVVHALAAGTIRTEPIVMKNAPY